MRRFRRKSTLPKLPGSRRKGRLAAVLLVALLLLGLDEYDATPVELALAPYRYSIVNWELSHLPDKWARRAIAAFTPGGQASADSLASAEEFFRLGWELTNLERQLRFPTTAGPERDEASLRREIARKEDRQRALRGEVEELIEGRLSQVAKQEGLAGIGGVFPPVDTVFTSSPHLLVISPRERIERLSDYLLAPGLGSDEKEALEEEIAALGPARRPARLSQVTSRAGQVASEPDWSVYVANTGGLSVYPSVVADSYGLHNAVEIAAHEWLHAWLFFKPLGRNFRSSGEMLTLNETVATIAGRELGDAVLESLTGQPVQRPHANPPPAEPEPQVFNFQTEMRRTRLQVDELLAAGRVEEAEAYMEEQRLMFVERGHLIRKLNQAYFAFHGTYATSPASVSPIGGQVEELRRSSASVGEFLKTVAQFATYEEFLDYLERLKAQEGNGG